MWHAELLETVASGFPYDRNTMVKLFGSLMISMKDVIRWKGGTKRVIAHAFSVSCLLYLGQRLKGHCQIRLLTKHHWGEKL